MFVLLWVAFFFYVMMIAMDLLWSRKEDEQKDKTSSSTC